MTTQRRRPLTDAQRDVCASCVDFARHLAGKFCRASGRLRDYDEALSAALEALAIAASTFDPGRGLRFTTYGGVAARRALGKWSRGAGAAGARPGACVGLDNAPEPEAPGVDAGAAPPRSLAADHLAELMAMIDPAEARALRLRALCGLTWAGVGSRLGCSAAHARKMSARAMRSLSRLVA